MTADMSSEQGPYRVVEAGGYQYAEGPGLSNDIHPLQDERADEVVECLNAAHAAGVAQGRALGIVEGQKELRERENDPLARVMECEALEREVEAAESALRAAEARCKELADVLRDALVGAGVFIRMCSYAPVVEVKSGDEVVDRFVSLPPQRHKEAVQFSERIAATLTATPAGSDEPLRRVRADTLTLAGAEIRAMDEVVQLDGQPYTPDGKTLRAVKAWLEDRASAIERGEGEEK